MHQVAPRSKQPPQPRASRGRGRRALSALAFLLIGSALAFAAAQWVVLRDQFDDDATGAVPSNMAQPGQAVIVTSSGVIQGKIVGERSTIAVVKNADGTGKLLRIGDQNIATSAAHAEVVVRPSNKFPGLPYAARFTLRRGDGPSEFVCSIIDNETTPGSGRIGVLHLRPDGFFGLGNAVTKVRHEPNHRYLVTMTVTPGADTTWGLQIVDLDLGNAVVLQAAGILAEDPFAQPALLKFETTDTGRGQFDLDDIEITVTNP